MAATNKTLRHVINVLSLPPSERSRQMISSVSLWLQRATNIFTDFDRAILDEIVMKAELKEAASDDIIVRQAEYGACMYVLLQGTVSIYVSAHVLHTQKSDASVASSSGREKSTSSSQGTPTSRSKEPSREGSLKKAKKSAKSNTSQQKDRSKLGRQVASLEAGACFGEVALIQQMNHRTASVVADSPSILLTIKKELYETTLKTYHEREYQEKRTFIERHPLFRGWSPRLKQQLEVSLSKQVLQYGQQIIRQWDACNGLIFVQSGEGIMTTEPSRHDLQYPERLPFKQHEDVYELVFNKVKKVFEKCYLDDKGYSEFDHIHVRRREGYAAAEKRIAEKTIRLCSVEPGDIIGDIELAIGLDTYIQSIECLAKSTVYHLSRANLDRLLGIGVPAKVLKGSKLADRTNATLTKIARHKLENRLRSLKDGVEVPLFGHLLYLLTRQEKPPPLPVPELKTSKELPDRETLFYHMLNAWIHGKAALIESSVPGGTYYKDLTREKAKERNPKGQNNKALPVWLKMPETRQKHPRTVKVLREALEQQRSQRDEQAYKKQLEDDLASHEANLSNTGLSKERLKVFFKLMDSNPSLITENTMFKDPDKPVLPPPADTKNAEDNSEDKNDKSTPKEESDDALLERTDTFVTQLAPDRLSNPDKSFYQDPVGLDPHKRSESMENFSTGPQHHHAKVTNGSDDDDDADSHPEGLTDIIGGDASNSFPKISNGQKKSRRRRRGTTVSSSFPSMDDVRGGILERVRESLKPKASVPENPAYRDWETSDHSLDYLERRIQQFAISNGAEKCHVTTLPKLKRFEAPGFVPEQPRPGGKVYIRHHPCPISDQSVRMKDHSHTRFHMIPAIEKCEQMRKTRMVAHNLIAESRKKWLKRHELP